jgi:hypothetical protein
MASRIVGVLVLLLSLVSTFTTVASAGGNSPAHHVEAGWTCVVAGPHNWVHCFPPGAFSSGSSLSVKVFDTDDTSSTDAAFLGTEHLIHADLYAGQPCPQDGGEEYDFLPSAVSGLPFDYRACHHYSTAH